MMVASREYQNAIYERFAYLATWLPNTTVRLGDIGIQQGQQFKQITTLKSIHIPFKIRTGNRTDFVHTSESGVTLKPGLSAVAGVGSVLPQAEAGVSMTFSRQGAFLFQARGCTVSEIENKDLLKRFVIKLFQQGEWDKDWAVVDTIVQADSATIVISNSESGSLDLTAKMPVALNSLARADAGLSIARQTGDVIHFVAAQGLTPMFKLSRIKQSLLLALLSQKSSITFGGTGTEQQAPIFEDLLEEVPPKECS